MLFENISYKDDLPFEMSFLNIGEESKHCHRELELLLVLRGVTHYQIYHTDYELSPGDLIIADVEDLHQIHDSSDDILMLSMHIDTNRFDSIYSNIRYMFFVCEECMDGPAGNRQLLRNKLVLLKEHIARMAFYYIKEDTPHSLLMEEINKLVSILVEHFQGFFMEDYQYKTSPKDMSDEDLQRLSRITRYIMLNYKNKISLDDISELEHLSPYYLSHLIKENLGFNFQNFVNAIRLEFAEKLLVFSNMTLMQISMECGFSSPNYFNKCFSAWHGKTPSQYRKCYIPCERSCKNSFTNEEALELLSGYLNGTEPSPVQVKSISPIIDFESDGFFIPEGPYILPENSADFNKFSSKFITAVCLAEAFEEILLNNHYYVPSCESANSLFSCNGLDSPAYSVYKYLAEYESPQVKASAEYALIKSPTVKAAVFFNTSCDADLNISIPNEAMPDANTVIFREISDYGNRNMLKHIFDSQKNIPTLLQNRINQCNYGKTIFLNPEKNIDFMVHALDTVILEFI